MAGLMLPPGTVRSSIEVPGGNRAASRSAHRLSPRHAPTVARDKKPPPEPTHRPDRCAPRPAASLPRSKPRPPDSAQLCPNTSSRLSLFSLHPPGVRRPASSDCLLRLPSPTQHGIYTPPVRRPPQPPACVHPATRRLLTQRHEWSCEYPRDPDHILLSSPPPPFPKYSSLAFLSTRTRRGE